MSVPVSELQQIAPSAIIELFELELNTLQHGVADTYRFHAGANLNSNGEVVWAGNSYLRFPIEADGFEYSGNGQLPRPKVRVSNIMGTITSLLLSLPEGLEGAKFTRIRTLARYLDGANFPARRNLLTNTNLFQWTEGATAPGPQVRYRQPGVALAPDGTMTATKVSSSTDNDSQRIFTNATVVANQPITYSVYAKAGEYTKVWIRDTFIVTTRALFDLESGTFITPNSNATSQFAESVGNGWYRIGITYTPTAAFTQTWVGMADAANQLTFTGDGTSGIYLWGAQVEQSATVSEYQPVGATWTQNPYGPSDPAAEFPREIFYVDRKTVETRDVVEFELAAAFDLAGIRAPKRQCIGNICQWKYRSAECGYTGPPVADANDKPVASYGTSALAQSFGTADAALKASATALVTAQANLATATNVLNAAKETYVLLEDRYNAANKFEIQVTFFAGVGTTTYVGLWDNESVAPSQTYRVGSTVGDGDYRIQRWGPNPNTATEQAAYNAALATYNAAQSDYNTKKTARNNALTAWQASPTYQSELAATGDVCGKRLSSCRLRFTDEFGNESDLPYGSFPGIGTYFT